MFRPEKHDVFIPRIELHTEIEGARVFPALKKPTAYNQAMMTHGNNGINWHTVNNCFSKLLKKKRKNVQGNNRSVF